MIGPTNSVNLSTQSEPNSLECKAKELSLIDSSLLIESGSSVQTALEEEKSVIRSKDFQIRMEATSEGVFINKIVPVMVTGPKGTVEVYAFLCNHYKNSLIDAKLADELGLLTQNARKSGEMDQDKRTVEDSQCVTLSIKSQLNGSKYYINVRAFDVKCTPVHYVDSRFPNSNLQASQHKVTPLLVLGLDYKPITFAISVENIYYQSDRLCRVKTPLGDVIYGFCSPKPAGKYLNSQSVAPSNHQTENEIRSDIPVHQITIEDSKEEELKASNSDYQPVILDDVEVMTIQTEIVNQRETGRITPAVCITNILKNSILITLLTWLMFTAGVTKAGQINSHKQAGVLKAKRATVFYQTGTVYWSEETSTNIIRDRIYSFRKLVHLSQSCEGIQVRLPSVKHYCRSREKDLRSTDRFHSVWDLNFGESDSEANEDIRFKRNAVRKLLKTTEPAFKNARMNLKKKVQKADEQTCPASFKIGSETAIVIEVMAVGWINQLSIIRSVSPSATSATYNIARSILGLLSDHEIDEHLVKLNRCLDVDTTLLPINATMYRQIADQQVIEENGRIAIQVTLPLVYRQPFEHIQLVAIPEPEDGKLLQIDNPDICTNTDSKLSFNPDELYHQVIPEMHAVEHHEPFTATEKSKNETAAVPRTEKLRNLLCNKVNLMTERKTMVLLPEPQQFIMPTDNPGAVEVTYRKGYVEQPGTNTEQDKLMFLHLRPFCKLYARGQSIISNPEEEVHIHESALRFNPFNVTDVKTVTSKFFYNDGPMLQFGSAVNEMKSKYSFTRIVYPNHQWVTHGTSLPTTPIIAMAALMTQHYARSKGLPVSAPCTILSTVNFIGDDRY
jgi:hypothetical protein